MAGRKIRWTEKVMAPELVLDLYRAIAAVQNRPDLFNDCHIYDGASLHHVPYVTFNDDATPLPKVIANFLGLPYGKKMCATHGCCNPMHFQASKPEKLKGNSTPPIQLSLPTPIDEYVQLVEYYVDKHDLKGLDFVTLRGLIPIEDMSDEFLTLSIEKLKS